MGTARSFGAAPPAAEGRAAATGGGVTAWQAPGRGRAATGGAAARPARRGRCRRRPDRRRRLARARPPRGRCGPDEGRRRHARRHSRAHTRRSANKLRPCWPGRVCGGCSSRRYLLEWDRPTSESARTAGLPLVLAPRWRSATETRSAADQGAGPHVVASERPDDDLAVRCQHPAWVRIGGSPGSPSGLRTMGPVRPRPR